MSEVSDRTDLVDDVSAAPGSVININKPKDWTSFDVVKKVRNVLKIKKVGHAGTLDPFATGVLLVCTGRATKKVNSLVLEEKEYVAKALLGKSTDTYDYTGKVTEERDFSHITEEAIFTVCNSFVGEIEQIPPMFSAKKNKGVRLYSLARKGITIERKPNKVTIHELEVLHVDIPEVTIKVVCSKGTYIRTLAHDIGRKLDCPAHLVELERTRIGTFRVDEALSISDFIERQRELAIH